MRDAFLLSAARTPIGKYLGGLADVSAPELGAVAIREVLQRAKAPADRADEVMVGNVIQAGVGRTLPGKRRSKPACLRRSRRSRSTRYAVPASRR